MTYKNEKRLRKYVKDFPLFIEVVIFFILLGYHVRNTEVPKLIEWVVTFRKYKNIKKEKLEVLVVFIDYILNNVSWVRNTCLNRSLALFHFLVRMGEPVIINFGVKKENDSLIGHGWLTKDNKVFLEKDEMCYSFTPILSFSADGIAILQQQS